VRALTAIRPVDRGGFRPAGRADWPGPLPRLMIRAAAGVAGLGEGFLPLFDFFLLNSDSLPQANHLKAPRPGSTASTSLRRRTGFSVRSQSRSSLLALGEAGAVAARRFPSPGRDCAARQSAMGGSRHLLFRDRAATAAARAARSDRGAASDHPAARSAMTRSTKLSSSAVFGERSNN